MDNVLDVLVIGSGPAGLCAGVYAERAGLNCVVTEAMPMGGGQITTTGDVENYLGFSMINGFELAMKFSEHAEKSEVKVMNATISSVEKQDNIFCSTLDNGNKIYSKAVIACTGAVNKKLGAKGEMEFTGRGVGYCAHCDGAFYRNKTTVVVGGGDTGITSALYLSNICKKVYVVHRRDELRGAKSLCEKLLEKENVEVVYNTTVNEIKGGIKVESVVLENVTDNTTTEISTDGVFVAIGITPVNALFKDLVETDNSGFIVADESCKTSFDGFYVAGDLRTKPLRQIVTAVADGANAVYSVEEYLREL